MWYNVFMNKTRLLILGGVSALAIGGGAFALAQDNPAPVPQTSSVTETVEEPAAEPITEETVPQPIENSNPVPAPAPAPATPPNRNDPAANQADAQKTGLNNLLARVPQATEDQKVIQWRCLKRVIESKTTFSDRAGTMAIVAEFEKAQFNAQCRPTWFGY